ncbi:GTP pyrophosphokinase family protein [Streptomyces cyaneofuscatus]|uniref:GTP pyrophosphokinase n=1 Tax=Streptomyces cyaneofuscatus TaxID=66883 RepID=UPI0036916A8B
MADLSTEELEVQYRLRRPKYESLCEELQFSLTQRMNEAGIKWHSITTRPKELDSFLEKVERKDYMDPFVETEDLIGARIVCLFMPDLDRTGEVISRMFEILNKEDKINGGDVSAFGYMSHHYICKLSDRYSGERYDAIKGLKFEIQVRTILMDAWANMSHYLSYKNEESVPKDLVKDFHALSALLYVGDRQFEALHKASSRSAAVAEEKVLRSAEIREREVNADTIHALLEKVFPGRRPGTAEAVSDFTSELVEVGYTDLAAIEQILMENLEAVTQRESKRIARSEDGKVVGIYSRVGAGRSAFDASDPGFQKYRIERRRIKGRTLRVERGE